MTMKNVTQDMKNASKYTKTTCFFTQNWKSMTLYFAWYITLTKQPPKKKFHSKPKKKRFWKPALSRKTKKHKKISSNFWIFFYKKDVFLSRISLTLNQKNWFKKTRFCFFLFPHKTEKRFITQNQKKNNKSIQILSNFQFSSRFRATKPSYQ